MAVQIQFGGQTRALKFDLRALEDLEVALDGLPLAAIINQLRQISIRGITLALWAGLKHEDKTLTPNLVRKMLQAHVDAGKGVKPIADALAAAIDATEIFAQVPEASDEDEEGNGSPERPTAVVSR